MTMHQNDAMLFSRKNHHQTGKITSDQMDLDEAAGCCEHLHDQAEALYAMLNAQIGEENA